MIARFFLILCIILIGSQAQADPKQAAIQIDAAIKAWMAQKSVPSATAAVSFNGTILGTSGYGGWTADADYPVASLSKAITGVCVARLIDSGKLALSDTVGKVLTNYLKTHPAPADPRMLNVTVEDLLTHRSGLDKNTFGDAHTIVQGVESTLASTLKWDPGTKFFYSDSGYLLVGFMADQANGVSYLKTCLPTLQAVESTGVIDGTMRERAPNGGWDISATNYVKFLRYFQKGSTLLGPQMAAFLRAPPNKGTYSLGAILKTVGGMPILTHTGLVHHDKTHPETGGSYYIVTDSGYAVVVIFPGERSGDVYGALDTAITKILLDNSGPVPAAGSAMTGTPAATGTPVFTALIDGKPWSANAITSVYSSIGGKPIFNLAARLMTAPESFFNFNFYLPKGFTGGKLTLEPGKPLQTSHGSFNSDVPSGDIMAKDFTFQSATVTVEHFDPASKTISGTFSGVLKNHAGNKILHITDGKFSGISYDPALME